MKTILLIAGHGGTPYDPGAVAGGCKEAEQTREMAKRIYNLLTKVQGCKPILYDMSKDAYKVLKAGGSLPLTGVDYVLELHLNAGVNAPESDGKTTGVEVLVHTGEKAVTVEQAVVNRIAACGLRNRGVKRRSDLLVMNTVHRRGISHALIEFAFIDDADDRALFLANRDKLALATVQGLCEGFGLPMPTASTTPTPAAQTATPTAQTAPTCSSERRYATVEDCPAWAQGAVRKLVDKGLLQGTGTAGLDLSHDMLRLLVLAERAGAY